MRLPREAELLQAAAVAVAAPRYMGAFAAAIGIDLVEYWPQFPTAEIASGAFMALLEGWAIAFVFRKWRGMRSKAQWRILLILQIALMLTLPAVATPYLIATQFAAPVNEIMPLWLLAGWSFLVAAIAPLVLAAVGYADVEPQIKAKAVKPQKVVEAKPQTAISEGEFVRDELRFPPELPIPKSEWRAFSAGLLRTHPQITGAELARRLGASERTGQNILREMNGK